MASAVDLYVVAERSLQRNVKHAPALSLYIEAASDLHASFAANISFREVVGECWPNGVSAPTSSAKQQQGCGVCVTLASMPDTHPKQ